MKRLNRLENICGHAKQRCAQLIKDDHGNSILFVLALITIMVLLGGAITQTTIFHARDTYWQLHWTQAFYLAEAGLAKTAQEFQSSTLGLSIILQGEDGIGGTVDDGLLSFGAEVELGEGNYSVVITDNDDGDGDIYTDTDNIVLATSAGNLPAHNASRTVQAYMQVVPPPSLAHVRGVITAAGPIKTSANLEVDGRNHDVSHILVQNSGVLGISTLQTFEQSGDSQVGGTAEGIDYFPSKPGDDAIIETSADWSDQGGFPNTPDEVLALEENTLKTIAQSGVNGSQYVTDASNLLFPLSGVTYVELKDESDPGLPGGHFDVDVFDAPVDKELYHEHEFDDKFDVTYIDIGNDDKLLFDDVIGDDYPNELRLEFFNAHNGSGTYIFEAGGGVQTGTTQDGFEVVFAPSLLTQLRVDFASLEDLRDSEPKNVQDDPVGRDDAFSVRGLQRHPGFPTRSLALLGFTRLGLYFYISVNRNPTGLSSVGIGEIQPNLQI